MVFLISAIVFTCHLIILVTSWSFEKPTLIQELNDNVNPPIMIVSTPEDFLLLLEESMMHVQVETYEVFQILNRIMHHQKSHLVSFRFPLLILNLTSEPLSKLHHLQGRAIDTVNTP